MTHEDFVKACLSRMESIYETDNAAFNDKLDHHNMAYHPRTRFNAALGKEFDREVSQAKRLFEETWDSDYK